jgi:hypothetical protein
MEGRGGGGGRRGEGEGPQMGGREHGPAGDLRRHRFGRVVNTGAATGSVRTGGL